MRNIPWQLSSSLGSLGPLGILGTFASRSAALGFVILAIAAPAHADGVAGSYDVKFEQISTNCEHPLPQNGTAKVKVIEVKGDDVQIDIERMPRMVGKSTKARKLNAKTPKPSPTTMGGMDGAFSIAGRITPEGMLSLVMVGEYQTAGKPLCSQSWNLAGLKAEIDKTDKTDKPDKPKK